MKLEIELNRENIEGIITELYAKGCNEVAKAIEKVYKEKKEIEIFMKLRDWN